MTWRVHLANSAVRLLEALPASRPQLAAWAAPLRLKVFDMADGATLDERTVPPFPALSAPPELWERYQEDALRLPNGLLLTHLQLAQRVLYLTRDGAQRLHWDGSGALTFIDDQEALALEAPNVKRWGAVDFDRDLGYTAAIAEDGTLYVFERDVFKGCYDVGLQPADDRRCYVSIRRGQHLYASDGQVLVAVGADGTVRKRQLLPYRVAHLAVSDDGQRLALVDYEDGIVRLYRGADLQLTHQRFAIDLILEAVPRQLVEELPPPMTAVGSLALTDGGWVAFSMGGMVCSAHQDALTALPR